MSFKGFFSTILGRATRPDPVEPHFVPLDLNSLNVSLGSLVDQSRPVTLGGVAQQPIRLDLNPLRKKIITFINSRYKNKIILAGSKVIINGRPDVPISEIINKFTPAIVYIGSATNANIAGIMFNSFNRANADLFNTFLNGEIQGYLKDTIGDFAPGIVLQNSRGTVAKKLSILSRILNSFSRNSVQIGDIAPNANKASVTQIRATVDSLLQRYSRIAPEGAMLDANVSSTLTNFLNTANASIIVIQSGAASAAVERKLFSDQTVNKIGEKLLNESIGGKPSFLTGIKDRLIASWLGNKVTNTKGSEKLPTVDNRLASTVTGSVTKGSRTKFEFKNRGVSLASLTGIINLALAEQIKQNMGTGSATDVLNYREGNLARSAKVEVISQSREGALLAFFSYMRFPYGTFSEGGKRQFPRSRDPVPLIAGSIRELAAAKVAVDLRAVLI